MCSVNFTESILHGLHQTSYGVEIVGREISLLYLPCLSSITDSLVFEPSRRFILKVRCVTLLVIALELVCLHFEFDILLDKICILNKIKAVDTIEYW